MPRIATLQPSPCHAKTFRGTVTKTACTMVPIGCEESDYKRGINARIAQKMRQFCRFRWLESVSFVAVQVLLFSARCGHYDYH